MKKRSIILVIISIIFILVLFFSLVLKKDGSISYKEKYLASATDKVVLYKYNKEDNKLIKYKDIARGDKVKVLSSKEFDKIKYSKIEYDEKKYFVNDSNLVDNKKKIVKEKIIYVRTASSVLKDLESGEISSLANKGDKLEVISFDKVENGIVNAYKVKINDIYGYIYGKYITFDHDSAILNYNNEIHSKIKNSYNGGVASNLDFYPVEKPNFESNKMPESVYALYLNSSSEVSNNIDQYIDFAKGTKINAFVVDIKENTAPAYSSEVMKKMSITSYNHAINSYEAYKNAIYKLKNNGYYVIGRITTFKDSYYVQDNPNVAISDKEGKPYLHNKAYWPSAYDRDVWYYNVAIAKEAIKEFGFNEINFDYVRFPDRLNRVADQIDMHNKYNEDKTQAIQRFLMYAKDEIHKLEAYVSADVFGETTNGAYTTAYGQYWPAISNVVDVISGMPYPDHFSSGYYGISKPWNQPYELMFNWGSEAYKRQIETTSPAIVRTWIQAYNVGKYVDINGIEYNSNEIEKQVRGLYDSKLYGGYITWLSNSSIKKYERQKEAFKIDYIKEYKNE